MILNSFYPLMGGAEKQAERLSIELLKKEEINNITILTRHYKGLKRREKYKGIDIVRLSAIGPGKLKPLTFLFSCYFYLLSKNKKFSVFHAHSLSFGGFAVSLFGKFFNKPSISKIAGGGSALGCEAINLNEKGGLKKWRLNFIKKNVNKLVAISKDIENDLLSLNVNTDKIVRINNGIRFTNVINKNKDFIELSEQYTVYLYAGRFEKIKGTDILLKAWNATSKKFRNQNKLVLIGKGSINVNDSIKDNSIINLGFVENTEEYLMPNNVFVLPSRYEGISNALLEAIKNKNFVIASEVGGNKDIIVDEFSGMLFEKENVDQLTMKLELFNKLNQNKKEEMINNSYGYIMKAYDLEEISDSYLKLYRKLVNGK